MNWAATAVKIGGVLVTSNITGTVMDLLIGCGVNVANPAPTVSLSKVSADLCGVQLAVGLRTAAAAAWGIRRVGVVLYDSLRFVVLLGLVRGVLVVCVSCPVLWYR